MAALKALAKESLRVAERIIEEEGLSPYKVTVLKPRVFNFQYRNNGSMSYSVGDHTREVGSTWTVAILAALKRIKVTPRFRDACSHAESAVANGKRARFELSSFVTEVLTAALDKGREQVEVIENLSRVAARELTGQESRYRAVDQLDSVNLHRCDFSFEIEGLTYRLRQSQEADLQKQADIKSHSFGHVVRCIGGVLETTGFAKHSSAITNASADFVTALSLFRTGIVRTIYRYVETDCILDMGAHTISGPYQGPGGYKIRLCPTDKLADFCRMVLHLLPARLNMADSATPRPSPAGIAYARYESGLTSGPVEGRIASLVMGLEALLSEGGDNLKYKLANRAARLLGCFGLEPLEVRDFIEEGYKIRNRYVHGDHFRDTDQARLTKLAGDVGRFLLRLGDYLRICIVSFLTAQASKKDIIALVDSALLDDASADNLRKLLRPAVHADSLTKPHRPADR